MDHIFLPRKLNVVKLRKCQCMEIRLTSYWSRKEGEDGKVGNTGNGKQIGHSKNS